MDRVFIEQLQVESLIGVYAWERTGKQQLVLDLTMAWDNRPAAACDKLAHALDYAAVCQRITEFAGQSSFELVETFAEQLAAILLQEFSIPWLRLKLTKPAAVPQARGVGVEIERGSLANS